MCVCVSFAVQALASAFLFHSFPGQPRSRAQHGGEGSDLLRSGGIPALSPELGSWAPEEAAVSSQQEGK